MSRSFPSFDDALRVDGRRTAATETVWYDDGGLLTDEVFNHYDNLLDQTQYFTYDLTGNRLDRTLDVGNNGTIDEVVAYSFDNNDRLCWSNDFDVNGRTVNSVRNRKFETGRRGVDGIR